VTIAGATETGSRASDLRSPVTLPMPLPINMMHYAMQNWPAASRSVTLHGSWRN